MKQIFKKTLFIFAIIVGSFLVISAQAVTVNQTVEVNLTVPAGGGGGGGGGGGPPGDNPPVISNVASSTAVTTATVSWSASDDQGISSVGFVYGLNNNYGTAGNVGGNYQVSLSDLSANTVYFFKISVTDTGAHTTEFTGSLATLPNLPPPPDVTPPVISNVQVTAGMTTANIKWDTNELADSQISYGLTNNYNSNYFDPERVLSHNVLLLNLNPNTTYHFKIISTDAAGNSANTVDATFTNDADFIPPPDVSNFILTTSSDSIDLSWDNPTLLGTPDFSKVKVIRKVDASSANPNDGVLVYEGALESFVDNTVLVNTNYFYTIFSFDTSGNHSPGIFRSGRVVPSPVPVEICGNGIDDNNNGRIDCADVACAAQPACQPENPPTSTPEVCGNGLDDDNNGRIDCADNACSGFAACQNNNPEKFACNNNIDDDSDGKKDFPLDKGCENESDNDEYNPPESTVPDFLKINLNDLVFLAGSRRIQLFPAGGQVRGLYGASLSVGVPEKVLNNIPQSIILRVGDSGSHQFVFNASDKTYYSDISFSQLGEAQAFLEINYGNNQFDSVGFKLNALPWGQVVDKDVRAISGVEVVLQDASGNTFEMGRYGQLNPLVSNANGQLGWLVPNGNFKISLKKEGYFERQFSLNNISNNVINGQWELITLPPKLEIDPAAPLTENIKNVAGALGEQAKILSTVGVQKIQDAITDPEVKKINQQVVAPAAITAVVAGAAPFISWVNILPFLRFLFLQPLMLLGWRKREKWGLVYNSLSKMPVDLAMVRLINADTGRVVQSKVTDSKGRFIFMVAPGRYRLVAQKNNFVFPSNFLAGHDSDGKKTDIYHGEFIVVQKSSSITATIPLDPIGATKKPSRLVWEKFGRKLQTVLGVVGILITGVSLYISPKWYIGVLLGVHVAVFILFRKLAVPPKVKNWGLVSDHHSKAPVSRVVARLFNSQFNKLVDMQVTDSDGKYHFIAGDAKYYVTYEHKDYHPHKTDIIDLEGKDADVISADVSLKKH